MPKTKSHSQAPSHDLTSHPSPILALNLKFCPKENKVEKKVMTMLGSYLSNSMIRGVLNVKDTTISNLNVQTGEHSPSMRLRRLIRLSLGQVKKKIKKRRRPLF